MRIVLDSQSTNNRKKRKLQTRFDELQQKLAKQEHHWQRRYWPGMRHAAAMIGEQMCTADPDRQQPLTF